MFTLGSLVIEYIPYIMCLWTLIDIAWGWYAYNKYCEILKYYKCSRGSCRGYDQQQSKFIRTTNISLILLWAIAWWIPNFSLDTLFVINVFYTVFLSMITIDFKKVRDYTLKHPCAEDDS